MAFENYLDAILTNINNSGVPVTHEQPVFEEKALATRDGVHLATDIFRPAATGAFPTIVQRGCYAEQDPLNKLIGREFAKRGFAYVFQFCRGIGRSEGTWEPKVNERNDGKDLVDWLQTQDWVASMGYYGSSYLAMTGWAIADIVPSKMKTMFLSNYGVHDYLENYHAGILKPDITTAWAMDNAGWKVDADYLTSAQYRPAMTADVDLWGGELPWYRDVLQSTTEDGHYWSSVTSQNLRQAAANIKLPLFISEGWYDHHLENALATYEDLPAAVKAHSVLQIGGWNHFGQPAIFDRETPNLLGNDFRTMLQWFKDILIDGQVPTGKILSYEINADTWHEQTSLTSENQLTFYLSQRANDVNGQLEPTVQAVRDTTVSYTYDPQNPVVSVGGEVLLKTANQIGSRVQPQPHDRDDVISFISEPLTQTQHLLGAISLTLNVATDVDDTDFVAKVMGVDAAGRAFNIRTTMTTVTTQQPDYQAGTATQLTLKMLPIDWQLAAGSRLRLDITSSDFPQYQIHSNFRGNQSAQAKTRVAQQQLILSQNTPSTLTLPVTHD